MSQQIQITGGAKVRDLQDVIIGSSGVLSSLGFNVANGVPQLDSNGKILVNQLPNSVMEYKGTWDASTNTPTLANGTGNQGDVYLCNVAGTVNFGAGPISFIVGDSAVYSGSIWQRAGGATGSVTSVGLSTNGNAITIGSSPITTSGTITANFVGTNLQYINGAGNLVTFPTIITEAQRLVTEVYNETGATLSKGTVVYINGGHGNLPTVTKAIATSDATSAQTYGVVQTDITNMNNGYVVVIGSLTNLDTQAYPDGTQLYLSSTTAGAWTSTKQYAPAHLVYVGIVTRSHPTQGVVEVRIQNGFELDELHNVSAQTPSNNQGLFYNSSNSLWENKSIAAALGYTPADDSLVVHLAGTETITGIKTFSNEIKSNGSILFKNGIQQVLSGYVNIGGNAFGKGIDISYYDTAGTSPLTQVLNFSPTASYTYLFPSASGTIALTSNLSSYVPYTGATTDVNLGLYNLSAQHLFANGLPSVNSGNLLLKQGADFALSNGYTTLYSSGNNIGFVSNPSGTTTYNAVFSLNSLSAIRTYTLPNASGTVALTSDLSSYVTLATTQTISGAKTFSSSPIIDNGSLSIPLMFKQYNSASFNNDGYTELYALNQYRFVFNFNQGSSTYKSFIFNSNSISLGVQREYTMPNASGTLALTSDIPSLSGYVQGTGTTNYLPKFTGTSTIGNSAITDDGSTITLGLSSTVFGTTGSKFYIYPAFSTNVNLLQNYNGSAYTTEEHRASDYSFKIGTTATLTISPTGAATFTGTLTGTTADFETTTGTRYLQIRDAGTSTPSIRSVNNTIAQLRHIAIEANTISLRTGASSGLTVTEALAISATGAATFSSSVGIGGTPTTKFELFGSSGNFQIASSGAEVFFTRNDNNDFLANGGSSAGIRFGGQQQLRFATGTSLTTRMTIDSTGNVGIGTASPQALLQVTSSSFPVLKVADGVGGGALALGDSAISSNYVGVWRGAANSISGGGFLNIQGNGIAFMSSDNVFGSGSERMRITSSGNVGIGTSSPSTYLHVLGANTSGRGQLSIQSNNSSNAAKATWYYDTYNTGEVGTTSTDFYALATNNFLFYAGGSERMRITSGGNVLIGTTTDAGQKLQVNGTALVYDELRMRSSSYGASYNTSLRSNSSAVGTLQFGNNGDNYILAGNTAAGGYLIFRVNCASESNTAGTEAFRLASNAAATFTSSVTATGFFESSDSRLKTLIQDNYQTKGIASITPKLYIKNGKIELGYYAQDFVGILDSAVSKGSDDMLSLSYREVLVAKVYALEQRIKELENK